MINRRLFKELNLKDWRTWFNPAIIAAVLSISAYLSLRLSHMGVWGSRNQLRVLLAGMAFLLFMTYSINHMTFGLYLLFFTSASINFEIDTGTKSPVVLAIIIVMLLALVWVIRMLVFERRFSLVKSPLNLPLVLLLVAVLVSWIASFAIKRWIVFLPDDIMVIQAAQYAMFVLSAVTFWLFANHQVSDKTLKIWITSLIVFGFFSFAYELLLRRDFYANGMNGSTLMWPVVLLFSQIMFNPTLDKRLRIVGIMALLGWGVWAFRFTFDLKGSWMPAVFGMVILIYMKNPRLGLFLGFFGALYILWSRVGQYFLVGETASLLRPMIWWDVIRMGLRSPIFGLGPAVYMFHWADPTFHSITFENIQTFAWNRFNFAPPSHNLYVDVFAQSGIVGIVIFLWFLATVVIFGWRLSRSFQPGFHSAYVNSVFAGFIAMAISSAPFADWLIPFVYNIGIEGFANSVYSWLFLGTIVSLNERLKGVQDVPYA